MRFVFSSALILPKMDQVDTDLEFIIYILGDVDMAFPWTTSIEISRCSEDRPLSPS